jgi:tRNA A-37 threonylcarbamoyl transferase component Bud32
VPKDDGEWRGSAGSTVSAGVQPSSDVDSTVQDSVVGRVIKERYRIVRLLGRGATGNVYEVQHVGLRSAFALKQLRADFASEPSVVARFRHEAEMMAQLQHPNIVRVFDIDSEPGFGTWMAMELVHGGHLGELLRRQGRLSFAETLRIGGQIAAALDCAHRAGLVHRDIKPANVLVESRGGRAVLTDFGIAKSIHAASADAPTRPGVYLGTYRYSSPEQIRSQRGVEIDQRADVYSLGVVLYEMISGRKFLAGRSENEIVSEVGFRADWQPPLIYGVPPPAALAALIVHCTMPRRDERTQSAGEVGARLAACATGGIEPTASTLAGREGSVARAASPAEPVWRSRRARALAVVVLLLGALLAAAAVWRLTPPGWQLPFLPDAGAAHVLSFHPDEELVVVPHATTQWFSVVLDGFDPDHPPPLRWLLDGKVVAENTTSWEYDPRVYHGSALVPQLLRFVVGSGRSERQSHAWQVKVAANDLSPVLLNASYKPGSKIVAAPGSTVVVKVDAYDPDGDPLSFAWRLDGRPIGQNAAEVEVPVTGNHQLTLAISDGEAAVSSSWQIVASPPGG